MNIKTYEKPSIIILDLFCKDIISSSDDVVFIECDGGVSMGDMGFID